MHETNEWKICSFNYGRRFHDQREFLRKQEKQKERYS